MEDFYSPFNICEALKLLLPTNVVCALNHCDIDKVYEIRVRRNCPIVVNYKGKNRLLLSCFNSGNKIYATLNMIEYIIKCATQNSLYAYNYQIKQGFITAKGGIRLGVLGESVGENNFIPTTIKNINSINIRVPHEIKNCSSLTFKFIYNKESGVKNTLIISPPGAGKTTFLRDIARQLSTVSQDILNCLIVDERFEICSVMDGFPLLDAGEYSDIVSGTGKMFAFTNGIRAMRPDVIITDELMSVEDVEACVKAVKSGVKVIASIHANNQYELLDKYEFKSFLSQRYFQRLVVLSNNMGPGTCEGIYDENLKCLYSR